MRLVTYLGRFEGGALSVMLGDKLRCCDTSMSSNGERGVGARERWCLWRSRKVGKAVEEDSGDICMKEEAGQSRATGGGSGSVPRRMCPAKVK